MYLKSRHLGSAESEQHHDRDIMIISASAFLRRPEYYYRTPTEQEYLQYPYSTKRILSSK
jgi:hypothetical protein